jgi:hypothetical protein
VTSTALNKLVNRSIFIFPGILGLFLTGLVSACSGNQAPQSNLGHNDTTASPPAQSFTPSTGAPAANSSAASQVVAASPSAVASPSQEHIAGIGSATVVTVHGKIVPWCRRRQSSATGCHNRGDQRGQEDRRAQGGGPTAWLKQ